MESVNNNFETESNIINEDIQSLNSIYTQLSTRFNDNFDEVDETKLLYKYIDECFDTDFKRIDAKEIITDVTLFNNKIVILIKHCIENRFNQVDVIFLVFCDYFDLPYNIMYTKLHSKIKDNILKRYIDWVGEDEYNEQKTKFEGPKDYTQPTLLDLLRDNGK